LLLCKLWLFIYPYFYFNMKYFVFIIKFYWHNCRTVDHWFVPGVLDKLTVKYRWAHFVLYFVVWQSSLSDSRQSKFVWNLAGGSIGIGDFGADVNNGALLNYSVFANCTPPYRTLIVGNYRDIVEENSEQLSSKFKDLLMCWHRFFHYGQSETESSVGRN